MHINGRININHMNPVIVAALLALEHIVLIRKQNVDAEMVYIMKNSHNINQFECLNIDPPNTDAC